MFSMRYYPARKCTLESDRVVYELVRFQKIFIKYNHYPSQCLKVADVILEKEKGPRLKKRIFEMIEADLQLVIRSYLGLELMMGLRRIRYYQRIMMGL